MKHATRGLLGLSLAACLLALAACAPEIGSEKWCNQLKDKPKGDWSLNEAADFAKHWIIK